MKKLSHLLASFTNVPDPVTELERAQIELKSAHDAVTAELEGMSASRQKALEDGDDSVLAALRQRRPLLEDERDRTAIAMEQVRQKLVDARATAKQARLAEHRSAHDLARSDFMRAAYIALAAFDAIVAVRSTAIREGFAGAMQAMEMPPNVQGHALLSRELLDAFTKSALLVASRRAKASVRKTTSPEPRMTDSQGPVRLGDMPVQRRTRRALLRETPNEGDVTLTVLKPGIELPGRGVLTIGDEVALPPDDAANLLRSGAVEIVTPPPPPVDATQKEALL
jgi:hypothetical protein